MKSLIRGVYTLFVWIYTILIFTILFPRPGFYLIEYMSETFGFFQLLEKWVNESSENIITGFFVSLPLSLIIYVIPILILGFALFAIMILPILYLNKKFDIEPFGGKNKT